jgi:hypothetical protein
VQGRERAQDVTAEISDEDFQSYSEIAYHIEPTRTSSHVIEISLNVFEDEPCNAHMDWGEFVCDCLMTTVARNRLLEVHDRLLTDEERAEFKEAKTNEWNSFVSNHVVEAVRAHGIDPQRIVGSRWILTWKPCDLADVPNNSQAVA